MPHSNEHGCKTPQFRRGTLRGETRRQFQKKGAFWKKKKRYSIWRGGLGGARKKSGKDTGGGKNRKKEKFHFEG